MIKYSLLCEHNHSFEGWFSRSSDFDDQQASGLLVCPYCASRGVRKAIMAPAVTGAKKGASSAPSPEMHAMMMQTMQEVRRKVEENFEDMGDRFAAEARAIHEGKSEDRGIYGEASPTEVRSLLEDGIRVMPLPQAAPSKTSLN